MLLIFGVIRNVFVSCKFVACCLGDLYMLVLHIVIVIASFGLVLVILFMLDLL